MGGDGVQVLAGTRKGLCVKEDGLWMLHNLSWMWWLPRQSPGLLCLAWLQQNSRDGRAAVGQQ